MKNSLLILILISFAGSGCEKELFGCLQSEGDVVQRAVTLPPFTKIEMVLSGEVVIKEGPDQEVIIEATDNVIDRILSDSKTGSDKWEIDIDRCANINDVKVFITVPELESVDITGAAKISTDGVFNNIDQINLEMDGDGEMDFQLGSVRKVDMEINGSGIIRVSGKTDLQSIQVNGSGDIETFALESKECRIDVSGDIKAEVNVSERLDIEFSGSGEVCYKGNPVINQDISGSGKIRSCN